MRVFFFRPTTLRTLARPRGGPGKPSAIFLHPLPLLDHRVDNIPLWAQICAIFVLLFLSAFFSISETSMMALNRHRLKHLANQGSLRARVTQSLLAKTDQLLSVILIGNDLINTIIPVLTTSIALRTFGHNNLVLSVTTGVVAFFIIVFAEIAPKIVGATYPEKVALPASLVLSPLMRMARPVVWFVNLFANGVLKVLHINTKGAGPAAFHRKIAHHRAGIGQFHAHQAPQHPAEPVRSGEHHRRRRDDPAPPD